MKEKSRNSLLLNNKRPISYFNTEAPIQAPEKMTIAAIHVTRFKALGAFADAFQGDALPSIPSASLRAFYGPYAAFPRYW